MIDKVTGKSVVRRVPFEPAATRASETLAIRAIELLRSSFLEIDLAAHDRRNEPGAAPPPAVVHFVETERLARNPERFGVEVGGAAVMSLDGVGPALLPLVRFDWSLRSWFLVQAALAGPRDARDRREPGGQRAGGAGVRAARRQLPFPRGRAGASLRDAVRRRAAHVGRGARRRAEPGPRRRSNGRFSSTRASVRRCACPIASRSRWRPTRSWPSRISAFASWTRWSRRPRGRTCS